MLKHCIVALLLTTPASAAPRNECALKRDYTYEHAVKVANITAAFEVYMRRGDLENARPFAQQMLVLDKLNNAVKIAICVHGSPSKQLAAARELVRQLPQTRGAMICNSLGAGRDSAMICR